MQPLPLSFLPVLEDFASCVTPRRALPDWHSCWHWQCHCLCHWQWQGHSALRLGGPDHWHSKCGSRLANAPQQSSPRMMPLPVAVRAVMPGRASASGTVTVTGRRHSGDSASVASCATASGSADLQPRQLLVLLIALHTLFWLLTGWVMMVPVVGVRHCGGAGARGDSFQVALA